MKARRYEIAGVHLGWAIPTGDGFILRHDDGRIEWSFAYATLPSGETVVSPRMASEEDAQRRGEARIAAREATRQFSCGDCGDAIDVNQPHVVQDRTGVRFCEGCADNHVDVCTVYMVQQRNLKAPDMMLLRSWDVIVPMLYKAYEAKEDFYEIYEKAESREEALELWELWKEGLETPLRRPFKPLITAVENWKPEIFSFFDHGRKTNAYTEAMNSVVRVVDRAGRGYSFDAIRAKVLYGGKRRKTDSEYKTVAVAMKHKVKVLVEEPPKLHKEKRKRD